MSGSDNYTESAPPLGFDQSWINSQLASSKSVDRLAAQILSQNTYSHWTGEGFGSVLANARNMAQRLWNAGITRLEDFGRRTTYVDKGGYDENGNYSSNWTPVTQFYNKSNYIALGDQDYGISDDTWAGTFAGDGSTAFKVQFNELGMPIFFSQYGGSSSDWGTFSKILSVASFIPVIGPFAAAINAVGNAYNGNYTGAVFSGLSAAAGFAGEALSASNAADAAYTADVANELGLTVQQVQAMGLAPAAGATATYAQILSNVKTVQQGIAVIQAIDSKNFGALVGAVSGMAPQLGITIPEDLLKPIQVASIASSVSRGDWTSALSVASSLTGNSNAKVAEQASKIVDAAKKMEKTGDPAALFGAFLGFAKATDLSKNDFNNVLKNSGYAKLATDTDLNQIWNSSDPSSAFKEIVTNDISETYQNYLGRAPSQEELNNWYLSGGGLDNTLSSIQNSPEAQSYYGSQWHDWSEAQKILSSEGWGDTAPTLDFLVDYLAFNDNNLAGLFKKSLLQDFADKKYVTADEVKAIAAAEGYTLTDAELASYAGKKNEADAAAAIQQYVDPKATTFEEAKQFLLDNGYSNPTAEEISAFAGMIPEATQKTAIAEYSEVKKYDDEFGDYQGAIDKAASRQDKVSFAEAFAGARNLAALSGEDPKTATFSWTNPNTGVTGVYKANTADEINAQLAADQKRIDLMPVYGGSQNTRTGTPTGAETVYIDTKTGAVVNDDRVFDEMGNVISGSIELADNDTKVAALQTAIGSSIRTALDIGAGLIKGGAGVIEGAGTFAGLLGADMDNVLRSTGKSAQEAVQSFRSNEFKSDQKLMNDAIKAAGGEGNFAQAMETLIQFGTNPVQAAAFIAEQGVSLLVGGGAMTAARALGAGMTVAEAASLTANAVLQGASVASETYDEKKKQGATEDEAKNAARAAGGLSGFVSAVANKYIPGAMSGEQMVAAQAAASTALRTALKGEMSSELVEETVGKVIQNVATGKAWDADLGTTAVQALIGSGVTTGLVHTTYSALDPIQGTPPSKFDGVTAQEFEAAVNGFSSQGYTPSISELADIVSGAPDASAKDIEALAKDYADQRIVSTDEATQMLADLGYENPTAEQIDQFVGTRSEADTQNAADQWVNANTVSRDEARQQLIDLGYSNPPDSLIDKLVGQYEESQLATKAEGLGVATKADIDAAIANIKLPTGMNKQDVADAIQTYMDAHPGVTAAQIAEKITTATAGLATPSDVQTAIDSALTASEATQSAQLAAVQRSLSDEIQAAKDMGLQGDAALQAGLDSLASKMGTNQADLLQQLGTSAADLKAQFASDLAASQAATASEIAGTRTALEAAIAEAKASGLSGDAALKAAIESVAADQQTSSAALLSKLGATEASLKSEFSAGLAGVSADVAATRTALEAAIAEAKASGLSGDAALKAAIESVAADQQTSSADLLSKLGATEASLKSEFSAGLAGVSQQLADQYANMTAAQKAEVDARVRQGQDLQSAITTVQSTLQEQISGVDARLQEAIAINEAAGLSRDQAISKAVDDVAASVGTTRADLLSQMGATEQSLLAKFQAGQEETAGQIAGLSQEMQAQYAAMTAAQKAEVDARVQQGQTLQAAIDTVQQTLSGQVAGVESRLTDAIAAAEAMGLSRDQAITAAVASVAADLGTTKDALLAQLGTTEQALRAQFTSGLAGVSEQVRQQYESLTAAQKAEADARVAQGVTLEQAIADAKQQTSTQIADAESRITQAMASAEAAGLSRDQALSAAVDSVAAELGTTRTDLLAQMGTTEANLLAKMQAGQAGLQEQITGLGQSVDTRIAELMQQGASYQQATQQAFAEVNAKNQELSGLLGTQGRAANQTDIDALTQMLGGQRQVDLSYDVNGDRQITQADLDFLTNIVSTPNPEWRPATGSPWAATGLYGQIQANEWQRQADEKQRQADEKQRQAAAKAAEEARAARDAEAARQAAIKGTAAQAQQGTQNVLQQLQTAYGAGAAPAAVPVVEAGPGFDLSNPLNTGFFSGFQSKKEQQNQPQTTKIATGGYLDDLLAENMTADDLLNLLR